MSKLGDKFKKTLNEGKLGKKTVYIPMYRTGIDIFDYINGYRKADGTVELGIPAGRVMMDVGGAGTGKTSKLIKQACAIADQFEDCQIFHYDFERSTTEERVMAISGWDKEKFDEKYFLLQNDISAESIYMCCKEIEKQKVELGDEIKYDTGRKDENGKPIKVFPPTILLIDSVAMMAPKDIEDDDELKGSMGASAIAKVNTNIFKRILSPCENASIIPMLVNHLTQKIEIGPVKSKAQVNFLGQDESIPGGKAVTYVTNTLTKLECGSKLTPDKDLGIKGFYLIGKLIKSRNTEAGVDFKMVFEQKIGINNLLTNFVNLKDMGRISGAGRSFKLDTCPDVKFALKDFTKVYKSNKELRKAFDKAVDEEYMKFIPDEGQSAGSKKSSTFENEEVENEEVEYELIDEENEVYTDGEKYYQIENGEYVEVDYEVEEEE